MLGRLALAMVVGSTAVACGASGGDGAGQSTVGDHPPSGPSGHPNVVFFLTDDESANQMVALPSVKELIADRGVTFTNAIAPVPLCCPARASLLTGRDPQNHGVLSNEAATGGGFAGLDQSNTVARWLQDAGYRTAHIGKYMNGYGPRSPLPRGWDEWWATSVNPFLMYDYTLNHSGHEEHFGFAPEDYKTDVLTRLATGFVRDAAPRAQPFYLQLWYTAPHAELGTDSRGVTYTDAPRPAPRDLDRYASATLPRDPSFNEADVSDKPAWVRALPRIGKQRVQSITANYRNRLASLTAVDEGIRAVVDAVEAAGELDRTVFVFTSDNGYSQGEHRFPSGKSVVYEPSIRVPFFVAGPGFRRGATVRSPITFADVAPTFARLAGVSPGGSVDGRPLQETMARPDADRAVPVASGLDTEIDSRFEAVRTTRWLYARYPATGESELYDLRRDPHELHSRQDDPKLGAVRAELERLLPIVQSCRGAACRVPVAHDLS
jgi:arylsulfatase A-like enzyme